jgi:peptidoglycan/LPS O-acetylase OafA/YrhL
MPKRFHSLDVVRGIAALSVVLWHWQHFFYEGTIGEKFLISAQPYYSAFSLFYEKGNFAVALFFSLSGFIFYWLYAQGIRERRISGREFFVLRFSRLYPLHFVTLIVVLIEQTISKSVTGSYSVYPCNDLYHFILNIFFLSNWGFEHGLSFNAPVWSVSIEVFLYILFFFVALAGGARSIVFTVLMVLGSFFIPYLPRTMTNGIFCFFIGGGIFLIYTRLLKFNLKLLCWITGSIAGLLWLIAIIGFKNNLAAHYARILPDAYYLHRTMDLTVIYFSSGLLFPATILFLALAETYRGTLGARIGFIGDISYSTYLWHFPLQLFFMLLEPYLPYGQLFFFGHKSFVSFFVVLLSISFLSYHKFERPMQRYIRNKLGRSNKNQVRISDPLIPPEH